MSKDKTLTFKTYHVYPLGKWLQGLELPGKQSRARNRFIDAVIANKSSEIEKGRIEMIEKYAKRDKKGELQLKKMEDGSESKEYDMDAESMKKYSSEYSTYMDEIYLVDVTAAKLEDFNTIAGIVLNTEETFVDVPGNLAATMYNEWCEVFEKL